MNIPEKYQADIETIISRARKILVEGKELEAVVFLGKAGCVLLPCPINSRNETTKDICTAIIREIARIGHAEYVITIYEGWGLDQTKVSFEELEEIVESNKSISEHPFRMDVFIITLETREGFWMAQSPIRPLNGKAREFDPVEFLFMTHRKGRFANFLPQEGTIH